MILKALSLLRESFLRNAIETFKTLFFQPTKLVGLEGFSTCLLRLTLKNFFDLSLHTNTIQHGDILLLKELEASYNVLHITSAHV